MNRTFEFDSVSKKQYVVNNLISLVCSILLFGVTLKFVINHPIAIAVLPLAFIIVYFSIRKLHKRKTVVKLDADGLHIEWFKLNQLSISSSSAHIKWMSIKDYKYEQTSQFDQFKIKQKSGKQTRLHFSGYYYDDQLSEFLELFDGFTTKLAEHNESINIKRRKAFYETKFGQNYSLILGLILVLGVPLVYFLRPKENVDEIGVLIYFIGGLSMVGFHIYFRLKRKNS